MKKILFLFSLPLMFSLSLPAQITQKEADEIVLKRMSTETKPHTIYAREELQTAGFTVTTSPGEMLELEYSCRVYYILYTDETNGKYLVIKESNGNLLEINTKNDQYPEDLEKWRRVEFDVWFMEYSLNETSCEWINLNFKDTVIIINSSSELENYINCTGGSYPEIDFSQYSILLAKGYTDYDISEFSVTYLQQHSSNSFTLNVEIVLTDTARRGKTWVHALVVNKICEGTTVKLKQNKTYIGNFRSVWKCIKLEYIGIHYDLLFDLIFYPSLNQFEIITNWTGFPPYGIYYIENNIMTWITPDHFNPKYEWDIEIISETKIILTLLNLFGDFPFRLTHECQTVYAEL